ncbi:MAG: alpha/beta hydrolase [Kiritimatiellae bacterium]|nr:alpha/beta hydrolase [Kiritimatiellia bacterium]
MDRLRTAGAILAVVHRIAAGAGEPLVVHLWPDRPPGMTGAPPVETEQPAKQDGIRRITNIYPPRIEMYRAEHPTGAAILVCPGGGYNILAISHEGTDVARWLNSLGITAALLYYRVPNQRDGAFQDAQRALSLLRARAVEWGLQTNRLGVLGFSAGGHLAAKLASHAGPRTYERVDDADDLSCRPDLAVLVYPAYLLATNTAGTAELALPAGAHCPPAFLVHAADDHISAENSVAWFLALRRAGVPAELHVYAKGGHGFGMKRDPPAPVRTWPDRCADWLREQGWARDGE